MDSGYPYLGFHFKVEFIGFSGKIDVQFQEVTGLSAKLETEDVTEGGENRFVHKLPKRTSYSEISLKRGMALKSELSEWCRKAIEDYEFEPKDLNISLLNDKHEPLATWNVVKAIPVNWQHSDLKAEDNSVMVETINLVYQYFRYKPLGQGAGLPF